MLDQETKRKIDNCRDILVGKVPDPKSQVEQITIALIYKFMDDMDKQAEEWGGKVAFFTGDYEKYSWSKMFDPRMGGHEMTILYGEAIERMNQNPNIPQLFRDIFKNAYLPYRDPETLKSFLKEINEFTYDHSERLGDAFEYLLSVLSSQGDAGQFRTPRHIIEFIVEVVDPKKNETVLDPACGTAGFLISSYRHILKSNKEKVNGDKLTTDEKNRLLNNFIGYDISPDMVRLSLVNLYLHGFANPKIHEYDTLTSEQRWSETADVIMANPPFMTPKGGIRPHKRFSIKANRSEVLFVDYIAEHLNPNGRAGVIVPEGIIFQSANAYKNLRKMLVENYLWCVVSLPAGVFNPYSGVKTSILLMDKMLSKKTDKILFVKIENDGFDLGAQRRPINKDDLPEALAFIKDYQQAVLSGTVVENTDFAHAVEKGKIADSGDWNLSGERYRISEIEQISKYKLVDLGELAQIISGQSPDSKYYNETGEGTPFYQGKTEFTEMFIGAPKKWTTNVTKTACKDDILMSVRAPVGPVNIATQEICIGRGLAAIRPKSRIDSLFLFHLLNSIQDTIMGGGGSVFDSISRKQIQSIQIPLPPLDIQKAIVAEIDNYQKIIDGARQVVDNYKPTIKIDPDWPMVELGEICEVTSSKRIYQNEYVDTGIPFYRTKEIVELSQGKEISLELFISPEKYDEIKKKYNVPVKGDLLITAVGTIGISYVIPNNQKFYFKDGNLLWLRNITKANPYFIKTALDAVFIENLSSLVFGAAYKALTIIKLKKVKIPLPPLPVQQGIITQIEAEQEIINNNKKLIEIYEQKIKDKISEVWGDK